MTGVASDPPRPVTHEIPAASWAGGRAAREPSTVRRAPGRAGAAALRDHDDLPLLQGREEPRLVLVGPGHVELADRPRADAAEQRQVAGCPIHGARPDVGRVVEHDAVHAPPGARPPGHALPQDRKSTRLNSSHVKISYAV